MTTPAGWPYPQTELYAQLTWTGVTRYGQTNDQWPMTEQSNDGLLMIGADGFGWDANLARQEWQIYRVTGTPPSGLVGTNRDFYPDGDFCKPQAMLCVGDDDLIVWYAFNSSASGVRPGKTFVARSTDGGVNLTLNNGVGAHIFEEGAGEDLMPWGCLQLGPGYVAQSSGIDPEYAYVYLTNTRQLATNEWNPSRVARSIWCSRVKIAGAGGAIANVNDRSKYALFQGMSGGLPTWGALGGTTGKSATFFDDNGMALYFNPYWHESIGKFVASYVHCNIPVAGKKQGIAIAISDSPFDVAAWEMLAYDRQAPLTVSENNNNYMSVMAPARWNTGTTMRIGVSAFIVAALGPQTGDNLAVTSATLSPFVPSGTSAEDFAAEEADLARIDAATGSSLGDIGGNLTNVATWDGVIGGAIGSAMDTSDTQFDWTSTDLRYAFDDVINNMPSGGAFATNGSGWLIWSVILIPETLSTAVEADFAVWDQITLGTHDLKYRKFGERVVRRMALTSHPLKRLILDINPNMNLAGHYRVFASTRTKYKNAMTRAINMIRQGAGEYQAGAGDEFHFLHRPNYRGDIGGLTSYCPDNVDCVGLTWRPGLDASSDAQLLSLMDGTAIDTSYGIRTDLVFLADALGGLPICFPEWGPRFDLAEASPIADLVVQRTYDFFATISHRLIADCVFDHTIRDLDGFDGSSSAGDAAWRRMVPLRKQLYRGETDPPPGSTPIRRVPHNKRIIATLVDNTGPTASLAEIANLTYRSVGVNNDTFIKAIYSNDTRTGAITNNVLDHGTAGMVAHGRHLVRFLIDKKVSGAPNFLWLDPEYLRDGVHRNVPQSVINDGWTPTHDKRGFICTYDKDSAASWRAEAVKWHRGVLSAAYQIAREEGLTGFEIGEYNIPSKTGYPGTASFTTQANETKTQLFDTLLSFGGPDAYFSSGSTGGYLSLAQMCTWVTNTVTRIRSAFGPNHRIMQAMWPRWFSSELLVPDGQGHGTNGAPLVNDPRDYRGNASLGIPAGTYVVPSGWFGDYAQAALDAGADGFFCYRSSGDDDFGLSSAFSARWAEVVDVIQADGDFIRPS